MLKKILILLFFVLLCAVWGIFLIYGNTPFLRKSYSVEAWWAKKNIHCHQDSRFLKNILENVIDQYGSLSNQIVYLKKNGEVNSCVSGYDVSEDTRFRYASLTKVVTAALFLENERLGRLQRNDYLSQYIQLKNPIDPRIEKVRLINLLTHTSGFDRTKSNDPIIQEGNSWCPDHLDKLNNIHLDHAPNTVYSYDNRNYCLIGAVLEKKLKQPFQGILKNYLKSNNFEHIQLVQGAFMPDEVKYDFRFEEYYFPSYAQKFNFHAMQSSAGLSGSAKDYAQLIHYLLYQRKLPLIETIVKTHDSDKDEIELSVALNQERHQSGELFSYHFGALPASRSLLIIRENGDVIVWMGSGVPQNPQISERKLLDYILYHVEK